MAVPLIRSRKYHGVAELGMSRYFALYVAQLAWFVLGIYLMRKAYWPSTCSPHSIYEIYACSPLLPQDRHFTEAALFTWLWTTPILAVLDISRRFRARANKRAS